MAKVRRFYSKNTTKTKYKVVDTVLYDYTSVKPMYRKSDKERNQKPNNEINKQLSTEDKSAIIT